MQSVGRIVAIDYGTKRVGLAVSDPMQMIAGGLTTIHPNTLYQFLDDYVEKEMVDTIVVGHPKQMNNKDSEAVQHIKPIVRKLKNRFPGIPIVLEDERFSSVIARDTMLRGGMKKKQRQNKAAVDKISATIILQSFLEKKRYQSS